MFKLKMRPWWIDSGHFPKYFRSLMRRRNSAVNPEFWLFFGLADFFGWICWFFGFVEVSSVLEVIWCGCIVPVGKRMSVNWDWCEYMREINTERCLGTAILLRCVCYGVCITITSFSSIQSMVTNFSYSQFFDEIEERRYQEVFSIQS